MFSFQTPIRGLPRTSNLHAGEDWWLYILSTLSIPGATMSTIKVLDECHPCVVFDFIALTLRLAVLGLQGILQYRSEASHFLLICVTESHPLLHGFTRTQKLSTAILEN